MPSHYGNGKAKAKPKMAAKPKLGKAKKPDFLDMDKDGDKKEPMRKAAKEAKKKPAAKKPAPKKARAAPKKKAVGAARNASGGSLARARETKMRMSNPSMTYA
tara:strand:+ start:404 stop:712 length:309 start_codon:yes stop_codon:yes gene_type:complete